MDRTRQTQSQIRGQRVRSKIKRFADRVRLVVDRSNKHIMAQLVDQKGKTIATVIDSNLKLDKKITKTAKATEVGKLIAEQAKKHKIHELVFDRGSYRYHGRVKALCEGAREAGLTI